MDPAHNQSVFRHAGLLGTVIDIRIETGDRATEAAVDQTIVDEMVRLEAIFSVFDPDSELSRWKRGDDGPLSAELVTVMGVALDWQHRSHGAFNPMSGLLSSVWQTAVDGGKIPDASELLEVARSIQAPRYELDDGRLRRVGDCSHVNLNAVAKGYIVDRALDVAVERHDPASLLVSAGGDLAHRGTTPARVGIENPLRPYDNEPPLTVIELSDAGLATSGGSRRGFRLGSRRFNHVIDPRSGQPVDQQASISVVAPSALEADVLATVFGTTGAAESVRASDEMPDIACLVIDAAGMAWPNANWLARFGDPTPPAT